MKLPRCEIQKFRPREANLQCTKPPHPANEPCDFGPVCCPTCGQVVPERAALPPTATVAEVKKGEVVS